MNLKILIQCGLFAALTIIAASTACTPKNEAKSESMPNFVWDTPPVVRLDPKMSSGDWEIIRKNLSADIVLPEALETKLMREERETWKNALDNLERYRIERDKALRLTTLKLAELTTCEVPESVFHLSQLAHVHQALQQHRNVLWRMGRLELALRSFEESFSAMTDAFAENRIKNADKAFLAAREEIVDTLATYRFERLRGDWQPGTLHNRVYRHMTTAYYMLRIEDALKAWNYTLSNSNRWNYLASPTELPYRAAEKWQSEYLELFAAFRAYAEQFEIVESDMASRNTLHAYACFKNNVRRIRVLLRLIAHVMPMQWEMAKAQENIYRLMKNIDFTSGKDKSRSFVEFNLKTLSDSVYEAQGKIGVVSDHALFLLDEANADFWKQFPNILNPIGNKSQPGCESPESWRELFALTVQRFAKNTVFDAERIPEKRGRKWQAFISKVLDLARSPNRIDEVEKGLLAISEVDAHMVAIRDEMLRMCKVGACKGFPEAHIENSPRNSVWVTMWRQLSLKERTLGHSLLVLKLCQLHLARQVQRLTEIYAWFAETSNANAEWSGLKQWQRIWTLYAEKNGTYYSFLGSVADVDKRLRQLSGQSESETVSETLKELLDAEKQLFSLTLDYAIFIDSGRKQPVTFDVLLDAWEDVTEKLEKIEEVTLKALETITASQN